MKHVFLFLFLLPMAAFAVDVPIVVPDGDPLQLLLNLVMNFKSIGPLAAGSVVVMILAQVFKQFVAEDFKYKRLVVTALGIIYGVLLAVSKGMGFGPAVVTAIFVSGGAVALYEALKPSLQKLGLA